MILKKFVKNGLLNWNWSEEKKPPRAQIFRYFCYQSRNSKLDLENTERWVSEKEPAYKQGQTDSLKSFPLTNW